MKTEEITLSIDQSGIRLIYQGLPLCNDKHSIDEIYLVCKMYKCDLPKSAWNGIKGCWVHTQTIEGEL